MLTNYFKAAWRNLKRFRTHTIINIAGLALGIACVILIFTMVKYHLSFDTFHHNKDRVYRIVTAFHEEKVRYSTGAPSPMGDAFQHDFGVTEQLSRVASMGKRVVMTTPDKKFEEEIAFADPSFFNIFYFPLLSGSTATTLKAPFTAAVTARIAKKYFGTTDVIGQLIHLDDSLQFTITAVLKDIPDNTDFRAEVYFPFDNLQNHSPWLVEKDWWMSVNRGLQCFVLLKPGVKAADVNNKLLPAVSSKYYDATSSKLFRFELQPLNDIHFNPQLNGYIAKKNLWIIALIGLLLIITTCINFVNLSIAQAMKRSKEIGLRKVLGGLRGQIFVQFLSETALVVLIAMLLAYLLALVTLPYVNQLFEIQLHINILGDHYLLLFLPLLFIVVVLLSGAYPGLVIAGFQPIQALKNKLARQSTGGALFRKGLVVTQFAISQLLIIGTIVVANQMRYSVESDPGFRKDAILMLPLPDNEVAKLSTLHTLLSQIPGVEQLTFCGNAPAADKASATSMKFDTRTTAEKNAIFNRAADTGYVRTFGLQLVAGRNLLPSDTAREFLVNETTVKNLQLPSNEAIIGKSMVINGGQGIVVGVVKDFHTRSFHEAIDPIFISTIHDNYSKCAVKVDMRQLRKMMPAIAAAWKDVYPQHFYKYRFLDEQMAGFYKLDMMIFRLIQLFTSISIIIGCIGLYGLVSFMAAQRTREVGIRKTLGASVENIIWLFSKEFLYLLLTAFVIAAPLAWLIMNQWLHTFAYRINLGAGVFVLAIFISICVVTITVGYTAIKTALMNPVKTLKAE
ncbi:MAG: ABC transporter permease [Chitinophaga sp.]|uniref:ABC transporter permease n=1 Tax=Chitinophaga sp. TaxID=1869181 RepID=UPI001B0537F6|nr:ABC transporter permease [Chitinophaga sp.]MBO9730174.1 ABC transporter permease [Chitinophaga sp.]